MSTISLGEQLSRRWGHAADRSLAATPSLLLTGGAWTLPTDRPLEIPPLPQMRLVVNLARVRRHSLWTDGRHRRAAPSLRGALRLAPANELGRAEIESETLNFAQIYIPRAALSAAGSSPGGHGLQTVFRDPLFEQCDDLVLSLVETLLMASRDARSKLYQDHLALALLSHLIARFGQSVSLQTTRGGLDPRRAGRARALLEDAIGGDVSLQDLADDVGMSPFHFARCFARTFGAPPHAYLRELRLRQACDRLRMSQATITQVALDCGYGASSAFATAFRRRFGVTPSQWRRGGFR